MSLLNNVPHSSALLALGDGRLAGGRGAKPSKSSSGHSGGRANLAGTNADYLTKRDSEVKF